VIFVPRGASADATRDPAVFDAITEFLSACGATPLTPRPGEVATALPELLLL
jgi:hypothetical protein